MVDSFKGCPKIRQMPNRPKLEKRSISVIFTNAILYHVVAKPYVHIQFVWLSDNPCNYHNIYPNWEGGFAPNINQSSVFLHSHYYFMSCYLIYTPIYELRDFISADVSETVMRTEESYPCSWTKITIPYLWPFQVALLGSHWVVVTDMAHAKSM